MDAVGDFGAGLFHGADSFDPGLGAIHVAGQHDLVSTPLGADREDGQAGVGGKSVLDALKGADDGVGVGDVGG